MTVLVMVNKGNNAPYVVMVQVQEVSVEGRWHNVGSPTAITNFTNTCEEYIHTTKRLVVYQELSENL